MNEPQPTRERMLRQVAVIAIRSKSQGVELCLIRRKGTVAWGIPKGYVDPGDTPEEAALNEAWEEAGLKGRLVGDPIGTYDYRKGGMDLVVSVYTMKVLQDLTMWPEMYIRERRWRSVADATLLLATHPVRPLLDRVGPQLADIMA